MAKTRRDRYSDLTQVTNIAMWGPTEVGKDWIIQGFVKEVVSCADFELLTIQRNGVAEPTEFRIPRHQPTENYEDMTFEFRRLSQDRSKNKQTFHNLTIQNGRGDDMVRVLTDGVGDEELLQSLHNSPHIILVLGIPSEKVASHESMNREHPMREDGINNVESYDDPFAQIVMESSRGQRAAVVDNNANEGDWGNEEYYKFLKRFFSRIEGMHRNIAVCMSKADQQDYRGNPWDIFRRRYGKEFEVIIKHQQRFHNIEMFYTSAAGYLKEDGRLVANFDGREIKDRKKWLPVNTAAPFYWIFENIELARWESVNRFFRGPKPAKYPQSLSY